MRFKVPRSSSFMSGLPPISDFLKNNPSDHEIWSIWCHIRKPRRLYIHLAFTYSVGPSSVVWSELRPAPPFQPMRVLEVPWSRALSLTCEPALSMPQTHEPLPFPLLELHFCQLAPQYHQAVFKFKVCTCISMQMKGFKITTLHLNFQTFLQHFTKTKTK